MIQPHGFIYNNKTQEQKREFLDKFSVVKILDFISIGKLFKEANVKVIAIEVRNIKKNDKHVIKHLTFRKSVSVKERMFFELDYYDYHNVSQNNALNYDFVWKANLLGGGRLFHLAKRLKDNYPTTIKDYLFKKHALKFNEGYKVGSKIKKEYDHEFFQNKKLLTERFKENKIDKTKLEISNFPNRLEGPRDEYIYKSPLIIIRKINKLPIALYNYDDILLYSASYAGIPFPKDKHEEMESFYNDFVDNQHVLSLLVNLFGTSTLTKRATYVDLQDIVNLPYPENGNFDMAEWENELIEDIMYMCNYINNELPNNKLMEEVSPEDIKKYNITFKRLMKTTFEDFESADEKIVGGFRFQAYSFYKNNNFKFEGEYKIDSLMKTTYSKDGEALYTQRILRLYTKNNLIIIKPNKLRYWMRSIAIRDVDSIIKEILTGDYNNE